MVRVGVGARVGIRVRVRVRVRVRGSPPAYGLGLGAVVPIEEQRTTRSSAAEAAPPPAASARTWFCTPVNSIACCRSGDVFGPAPTVIATVLTPFMAAVRVLGCVTLPRKMPSLASHLVHLSVERAFSMEVTSARTVPMRESAFSFAYRREPVRPVAPVTRTVAPASTGASKPAAKEHRARSATLDSCMRSDADTSRSGHPAEVFREGRC